jgi:hypothetical protein
VLARRFLLACALALASVGTAHTQPIRWVPAEFEPQEEGVYTVRLTASSASGSDTIVRTEYISVPEPDTWLRLCLGCGFLFALNNRRETGGSEACRG